MKRKDAHRLMELANRIANAIRRRVLHADVEELSAAALYEVVRCFDRYDPELAPLDRWASGVMYRAAMRSLLRSSVPTSGHQHDTHSVRATKRVVLDEALGIESEEEYTHLPVWRGPRPDSAYEKREFRASVRNTLEQELGAPCAEFAFAFLTREWNAEEIAEASNASVEDVYAIAATVRRRLEASAQLRALWESE